MATDRIAEIRARLDAATPGPWEHVPGIPDEPHSPNVTGSVWLTRQGMKYVVGYKGMYADNDFIAHAPDDIRYLLYEVEELKLACEHWQMFNRKAEERAEAAEASYRDVADVLDAERHKRIAAEGEVERLREALRKIAFLPQDYPEHELLPQIRIARAALDPDSSEAK